MPALTIRNIPDEIHRGLKSRAARHGRSTEAEVREILVAAVKPADGVRMGDALAAIWQPDGLMADEVKVMESVRDQVPATPMSFDE